MAFELVLVLTAAAEAQAQLGSSSGVPRGCQRAGEGAAKMHHSARVVEVHRGLKSMG